MEKTIWTDYILPSYPEPAGEITAEVAIIGGGLAGIMAAEALNRAGYKVAVLEADRIGGGETAKSTAMVSYAHDYIYSRLISKHGKAAAKEYLVRNTRGLNLIRDMIQNYGLDAEMQNCDMVLFATTSNGHKKILNEKKAYELLGGHAEFTDTTELPFDVTAALRIKNQLRLNPYKFVTSLAASLAARGVQIYENARVFAAPDGRTLHLENATVTADKFIIATHFPYIDIPGWYFMKMYQSRNHNVAFRYEGTMEHIYESIEAEGFEYRAAMPGIIICGGASVRTGDNSRGGDYNKVREEIKHAYGAQAQHIVCEFAAQDCITYDLLPFAGHYGGKADNIYVITGFNKWGFTQSAAAAETICSVFSDGKYKNMFDPSRIYMLKSPIKSLKNLCSVVKGYASGIFYPGKYKGNVITAGKSVIMKSDGKRTALYMREDGKLDCCGGKCTHLGGPLKWNADDKTWDCPCHGSRFDTKGEVISGPATVSTKSNNKQ